ncbi:MAG TPA: hypothetical protein VGL02_31370 [Streptomyces sp.]
MALSKGDLMPGVRTTPIPGDDLQERENTKQRARRSVAHHAHDAADCAELLRMLGLHPHQEDREIAY